MSPSAKHVLHLEFLSGWNDRLLHVGGFWILIQIQCFKIHVHLRDLKSKSKIWWIFRFFPSENPILTTMVMAQLTAGYFSYLLSNEVYVCLTWYLLDKYVNHLPKAPDTFLIMSILLLSWATLRGQIKCTRWRRAAPLLLLLRTSAPAERARQTKSEMRIVDRPDRGRRRGYTIRQGFSDFGATHTSDWPRTVKNFCWLIRAEGSDKGFQGGNKSRSCIGLCLTFNKIAWINPDSVDFAQFTHTIRFLLGLTGQKMVFLGLDSPKSQ